MSNVGKQPAPSKHHSGPYLIQYPGAPLIVILAIGLICCLSLASALIRALLAP